MTTQPVDTLNTPDVRALAAGAASAAAPLIPSPHPLTVSRDKAGTPDGATPVFVATFTGATSGEVLLALDASIVTALTSASVAVQVEDAVQPALEAAAQSLGPCVLGPVRSTTAQEVAAATGTELVALLGNGAPTAWVGLTVRGDAAAPAPRRQQPGSGLLGSVAGGQGLPMNGLGLHLLRDVEMTLSVEIGRARMTVRDLLQLAPGSVVELDRAAGAPADLLVNGRLIARGEVVVVDEDFGLRITELVQPAGEASL